MFADVVLRYRGENKKTGSSVTKPGEGIGKYRPKLKPCASVCRLGGWEGQLVTTLTKTDSSTTE